MKLKYENQIFGEERALYNLTDIEVNNCLFDGEEDGESAIKECTNVIISDSTFNLRYPLWRMNNGLINHITMNEGCRSAIWYSKNLKVTNSYLHGVKVFRMCNNIEISNCDIDSIEFGWSCKNISLVNSKLSSEYPFLGSKNVIVKNCEFHTKYPFQQTKNVYVENMIIDAKDAFWDSENVTCKNCTLIGDFLAWHSKNLTFINCKIISSQPLCYVKNLKIIDCVMEDCTLAFEYSSVKATIKGSIKSIKNPLSGLILADNIGAKVIGGNSAFNSKAIIKERN